MKKTMKPTHRVLSLLLVLAMVFTLLPLSVSAATVASGTCGQNLTWALDSNGTLTISGTGDMWPYLHFSDVPWDSNRAAIKSVVIGNGVTSIDDYAFYNCTALTGLTIPSRVTSIGRYAFYGCTALTNLTIPGSVTYIDYHAFMNCTALTSLTIPNGVTTIRAYTFSGCSALTGLTIPNSVTAIGDYAFSDCSALTNLTIPNRVTTIGAAAFASTGLSAFVVAEGNPAYKTIDGVLFTKDEKTLVAYPAGRTGDYTIPDGTTQIDAYAFQGSKGLTSVTIPNSVTSISDYAFSGCSALTDLTISDGVTSIGSYAFRGCSALTDLTIPNSVTSIGSDAFSGCKSLTDLTISDGVTSIGGDAFYGCTSLTTVTIPDSVTSIGNFAFRGCRSLTSVAIPGSVTSIGWETFSGCSALTDLTILDGVTSIGTSAFRSCSALTSVSIPDSVTSIGNSAFANCGALSDVYTNRTEEEWANVSISSSAFPSGVYYHYGDASECAYTMNQDADGHWMECTCGVVTSVSAHVEETVPAKAVTCTEDGMTEGSKCSVCGWIITGLETIPATGHAWDEGVVTADPACESEGVKTFTCGNNAVHTYTEVVSAAGHDYTAVVTAPTCTEQGYTTYTCHCGDSYVADDVDATGHAWDEGVVTIDPVCQSEGVKTFTCANDAAHIYTEAVSETGHTEEIVPAKSATCTEEGLTEGSKCGVCGVTLTAQETIGKLAHTEETVSGKAAGCTEDGLTEGSKCSVCGEILKEHETIPAHCPSAGFSDLSTEAWYHQYTDFVIGNGYITGYPGNLFGPDDTLSRAQMVQVLYNLEGRPAVSGEDDYTDTNPEAWYTDAILWATENSLVLGYGDNKFGPEDLITREQMATIFYRYAQMKGYDLTEGDYGAFSDAEQISEFAKVPMGWAVGSGLITGMGNGTLDPTGNSTRAQKATILTRFIDTFAN